MSKKIKLGLLVFAVLAVGSAIFAGQKFWGGAGEAYHAVYLRSGDIYFGVLDRSPKLLLGNAYALVSSGDAQAPFQIVKLTDMAWGPAGELELNEKQVLWIAELDRDGTVMKHIQSQKAQ